MAGVGEGFELGFGAFPVHFVALDVVGLIVVGTGTPWTTTSGTFLPSST
jgi:hypothetical protein